MVWFYRNRFDQKTKQAEANIGILHLNVVGKNQRILENYSAEGFRVWKWFAELPVVSACPVSNYAGAVCQELLNTNLPPALIRVLSQPGKVEDHTVIEA